MGTKVPVNERSRERKFRGPGERKFPGTKSPGNESSLELSFLEIESSQERKVLGTKVPGTFVPWGRKFSIGTFHYWERKVLGTKSLILMDIHYEVYFLPVSSIRH